MERYQQSNNVSTPDRHNSYNQQSTSSSATTTQHHVQTDELPAGAIEVIKGHLYFVPKDAPSDRPSIMSRFVRSVIFSNDPSFIYTSYFADFGPLDLGITYQFCRNLQDAMHEARDHRKYVLFYAGSHEHKKANSAACLMAYLICVLDFSVERSYRPFIGMNPPFIPFRDAGFCVNTYPITVLDIARAWRRAKNLGHFDFRTFNLTEFQNMAKLQNGDMSWIIPGKFIAFSGPLPKKRQLAPGVFSLLPEQYVPLFKDLNVTCVVRFNEKMYDRRVFLNHGIRHVDLFYEDGGNPTDAILNAFLQVCEQEKGAIAVHCKAGLGRTGTNIAAYMIKHYGYTAKEAIAWSRLCRPGCVVGPQQQYISVMENKLKKDGEEYRLRHQHAANNTAVSDRRICGSSAKSQLSGRTTTSGIVNNKSCNESSVNNTAEKTAHYKTIHTGLQQLVNSNNANNTKNVKRKMSDSSMSSSENMTSIKPVTAIGTTRKKSIDGLTLPAFSRAEGKLPTPTAKNNNNNGSSNRLLSASVNTTLTAGIAALSTGNNNNTNPAQSETDDNDNQNNFNNKWRAFDYPGRPRTSDGYQRTQTNASSGDLGTSGMKQKDNISFIIPPPNNTNNNNSNLYASVNNVSTTKGGGDVSLQPTSVSLTHTVPLIIDTSNNITKNYNNNSYSNSNNARRAHSAVPTSNNNSSSNRLPAQTHASEMQPSKAVVTIPSTSSTPTAAASGNNQTTSFGIMKRESSSNHAKEAWSESFTPRISNNNTANGNNKIILNSSFSSTNNNKMPTISTAINNGIKSSSGTPRKSPNNVAGVSPYAMPVAPNSALKKRLVSKY